MNLPSMLKLPAPPPNLDSVTRRYLEDLNRAITLYFQKVYQDLEQGAATLTTYSAAPTIAQVATSQMALRTDTGNEKIYVNVGGTMMSATLT